MLTLKRLLASLHPSMSLQLIRQPETYLQQLSNNISTLIRTDRAGNEGPRSFHNRGEGPLLKAATTAFKLKNLC